MPWQYDEEHWCTWPFEVSPVPSKESKTNLKAFAYYFFGDHDLMSGVAMLGGSSTIFVTGFFLLQAILS